MDPLVYEEKVMQTWDSIRALLLEGDMGTLPRDIFESLADWIYDKGQNDALDAAAELCKGAKLVDSAETLPLTNLDCAELILKLKVDI